MDEMLSRRLAGGKVNKRRITVFKTVVADLETMDKRLVQLEARQLARMTRKLKKLDEPVADTEFETRGRKKKGHAQQKIKLYRGRFLERTGHARFVSSLDTVPGWLVVLLLEGLDSSESAK